MIQQIEVSDVFIRWIKEHPKKESKGKTGKILIISLFDEWKAVSIDYCKINEP